MRVEGGRKAVVVEVGRRQLSAGEVDGLRHAARGEDADELVEVGVRALGFQWEWQSEQDEMR